MLNNKHEQAREYASSRSQQPSNGPEKCSLAETQDKAFKKAITNMFKDLKENLNECLNEDRENKLSETIRHENRI